MAERKPARNPEEKNQDYKSPLVENRRLEIPKNEPGETFTITVTDSKGNVLTSYSQAIAVIMAVATMGAEVAPGSGGYEVEENIGSVAVDGEELAAIASTFTKMWPVWLDEHPDVRATVAADILDGLKKPFVG